MIAENLWWQNPYLVAAKVAVLLLNFLPYSLALDRGWPAWVMVGTGSLLIISLLLHRRFGFRLSTRARLAWVLTDALIYAAGMHLAGWSSNYMYLVSAVDAALLGWRRRRGVLYLLSVLGLILGIRALTWPGLHPFVMGYAYPMAVALAFIQALVYILGQVREQQEAAAKARDEADRARQDALLANVQLREYARQVEELAVLKERTRIAREVHDTVAHVFTGMIMQLEAVKLQLHADPDRAGTRLEALQEKARESLDDLRRSVHALRPVQLEQGQGLTALRRLVEDFGQSTGVKAEISVSGTPGELTASQELCLYRAVQEGLSNAVRHGRASRIAVRFAYTPTEVTVTVEDDGRGPEGARPVQGTGLVGIRERAEILGGRVLTGAREQGGFQLRVILPVTMVMHAGHA